MMETTEQAVRVTAKARKSTDGTMWVFLIQCPFCGGPHLHGAGVTSSAPDKPDPKYFGLRAAHCDVNNEYFVESASK